MTNLRRFYLSSDAAISEHDAPDGTWCRAADATASIEALSEKVADLQAQIATLQNENAMLAGWLLEEVNIFSYTEPTESEKTNG